MRRFQFVGVFGLITVCCLLTPVPGNVQSKSSIAYWRATYERLLPADDARVTRAQAIFNRVVQAVGTPPGTLLRLFIIKETPWDVSLPIALPEGWIVLSKDVLDICYHDPRWGDDRLAFVLAHEIAHQLNGDFWHLQFFQAFETARTQTGKAEKPLEEIEAFFRSLSQDRPAQELRADERGLLYTTMAGFNPQAIVAADNSVDFFQDWFQARDPRRIKQSNTHPEPGLRTAALQAHLGQMANRTATFQAGLWFYYAGNYPKAIDAFEHFLAFFPSREVYHNLAMSHHQLALQAYQSWRQNTPILPFRLSFAMDPLTRANQAFLRRRTMRTQATDNPMALSELFRHHLDRAITLYRKALSLDPSYTPASVSLGCALILRGVQATSDELNVDFSEASIILQKALRLTPQSAPVLNNLGVALFYTERSSQAKAYLQRARSLAPAYVDPIFNLATIARLEKREASAQDYHRIYTERSRQAAPAQQTDGQRKEHIRGLKIGYLAADVPDQWGTPMQSHLDMGGHVWILSAYPTMVKTLSRNGEILILMVDTTYSDASAKGITIGSTDQDVLTRYGSPSRRLETTQGQSWGYDTERIAFQLRNGRVVSWLIF